ncbi:MAG: G-D-S-L family lipolytic protein, partial [Trichodesmium sp. St7_bin2_1]|nr:G-D-S-L family lipolytic protein [Trichodesmium sp. St7_bin2_1]
IYKEATRLACLKRQIPYLDVFEKWLSRGESWWRSRLCNDGIHPNVRGYQALLEDVVEWNSFNLLTT